MSGFPGHVLGREQTDDRGGRWGYKVIGEILRLPELDERPSCRDCVVTPIPAAEPEPAAAEIPEAVVLASTAHNESLSI